MQRDGLVPLRWILVLVKNLKCLIVQELADLLLNLLLPLAVLVLFIECQRFPEVPWYSNAKLVLDDVVLGLRLEDLVLPDELLGVAAILLGPLPSW